MWARWRDLTGFDESFRRDAVNPDRPTPSRDWLVFLEPIC